jgi:hypothetical protein
LGWGQDGSGLGCDLTGGDPVRIDPEVRLIPATITDADDPFSWVTFSGRWGERETWVYDGPTGPAFKRQWSEPLTWMDGLRADSLRVSTAAILGPNPSDIFCGVVKDASVLLALTRPYPLLVAAIVAIGIVLAVVIVRLSWANLRRTWRLYREHFRLFAGIGAILAPAILVVSAVQYLLSNSPEFAAMTTITEDSPELQGLLGAVSLLQRGILLIVVTPAVIQAVSDITAGTTPSVGRAFREGWRKVPGYLWTFVRATVILFLLTISIIGIPWAVNRGVRWLFGGQAAMLDGVRGKEALARSSAAVKGQWWQMAANSAMLAFLAAAPGIAIALLLLTLLRLPLDAANSVAALVYAVAQPFAIAGLTLLYLRGDG